MEPDESESSCKWSGSRAVHAAHLVNNSPESAALPVALQCFRCVFSNLRTAGLVCQRTWRIRVRSWTRGSRFSVRTRIFNSGGSEPTQRRDEAEQPESRKTRTRFWIGFWPELGFNPRVWKKTAESSGRLWGEKSFPFPRSARGSAHFAHKSTRPSTERRSALFILILRFYF